MQLRRTVTAACAMAMLFGMACSSSGSSSGGSTSSNRDVLTRAEMDEANSGNVYDAIQRLRPSWLRVRGGSGTIQVMMNSVRVGDVTFLQTVRADNVIEVQFVNSRDATTKWGTGFTAGAIDIITR